MKIRTILWSIIILIIWGVAEVLTLYLLLDPPVVERKFMDLFYLFGCYCANGMLAIYYFKVLAQQKAKDEGNRRNALLQSSMLIAAIPVMGPAGIVTFVSMLAYWPVKRIPEDEYEVLDDIFLKSYPISLSFYEDPCANLIDLIYGTLDQPSTFFLLRLVEKLPWTPHKTRILQMLLEYSRYPKVIVNAASLLAEKKNTLFNRISELEKNKESNALLLACEYHEIYYLSLVDAQVGKFYLDKACEYIEKAVLDKSKDLDILNLAIRFFLENKCLEKAEQYLIEARDIILAKELLDDALPLPQDIEEYPYEIFARNNYEFFESNLKEIAQLKEYIELDE